MEKPKIKAIIFDVAGVLVGGKYQSSRVLEHSGVHEYMAKKMKMDLDSWIDAIETPYNKSMEGQIDGDRAVKWIAENLKINEKKLVKIWAGAYDKKLKKNKKLYKIAFKLKEKGYIIGILSDQWFLSKKSLTPEENLRGFDPVIISCDVGMRKPNPMIYKLLMKKLKQKNKKIKTNEVIFTDNRDWNLTVPRNMGINVIVFKDDKQFLEKLKKLGIKI
jgi:putative hydrolase of the HAD superfamily